MCMWERCVHATTLRYLRAVLTGGPELPDVSGGNRTWIFCAPFIHSINSPRPQLKLILSFFFFTFTVSKVQDQGANWYCLCGLILDLPMTSRHCPSCVSQLNFLKIKKYDCITQANLKTPNPLTSATSNC